MKPLPTSETVPATLIVPFTFATGFPSASVFVTVGVTVIPVSGISGALLSTLNSNSTGSFLEPRLSSATKPILYLYADSVSGTRLELLSFFVILAVNS